MNEAKLSSNKIFMICDAYESGVGKGKANKDTCNPYPYGSDCYKAWMFGWEFGQEDFPVTERAKLRKP